MITKSKYKSTSNENWIGVTAELLSEQKNIGGEIIHQGEIIEIVCKTPKRIFLQSNVSAYKFDIKSADGINIYSVSSDELRIVDKSKLDKALGYGEEAFKRGLLKAPAQDSKLITLLEGRKVGETPKGEPTTLQIFEYWIKGWNNHKKEKNGRELR